MIELRLTEDQLRQIVADALRIDYDGDPKFTLDEIVKEARSLSSDGWISVEDRLPEGGGDYIIVVKLRQGTFVVPAYLRYDTWVEYREYCGNAELFEGVTHWMPLPDPPEAGK